jgi:excisionase family DNA binding protein
MKHAQIRSRPKRDGCDRGDSSASTIEFRLNGCEHRGHLTTRFAAVLGAVPAALQCGQAKRIEVIMPEIVGAKLLTVKQVAAIFSVHRSTVWRLVAAGELPAPVRIGRSITRWRADEIENFVDRLEFVR